MFKPGIFCYIHFVDRTVFAFEGVTGIKYFLNHYIQNSLKVRGSNWQKLSFAQTGGTKTHRNNKTSVSLSRILGLGILQALDDMVSTMENICYIYKTNVINLMVKNALLLLINIFKLLTN